MLSEKTDFHAPVTSEGQANRMAAGSGHSARELITIYAIIS
jgi:hypothetical protein